MGRKKRTVTGGKTRGGARAGRTPSMAKTVRENDDRETARQECSEGESQDSNGPKIPVVSVHKNFGKFRCLADRTHLADICVDGCAAVNNIEVKIVDPNASYESENSNSVELPNAGERCSASDVSSSGSIAKLLTVDPDLELNNPISFHVLRTKLLEKLNSEGKISLGEVSYDTQLPDPVSNLIVCNDPRRKIMTTANGYSDMFRNFSPYLKMGTTNTGNTADRSTDDKELKIVLEKLKVDVDKDEDEMYTVFEILDDNVPEPQEVEQEDNFCLFSESIPPSIDDSPLEFKENVNDNVSYDEPDELTKKELLDRDISDSIKDFETRINNLILFSRSKKNNSSNNSTDESPSTKSRMIIEDKKLEDIANASESCSTPTSAMSEDDTNGTVKLETDNVGIEKSEPVSNCSTDSSSSSITGIRRSSRIKTINVLKQRSRGHGLVKTPQRSFSLVKDVTTRNLEYNENAKAALDKSISSTIIASQNQPTFSVPTVDLDNKPVKVKSRWRRSSEMEMGSRSPITPPLCSPNMNHLNNVKSTPVPENPTMITDNTPVETIDYSDLKDSKIDQDIQERLSQFKIIPENEYHCDRAISKEARKMTCDCFLTKEETDRGELGCGDDCLNRLLMIECNSRCPVGDRCTNRRFQSRLYSDLRVIKTEKKGLGIEAIHDIPRGEFLMEYVGEVLNWEQFNQRAQEYSSDKNTHHYFMSLKGDAVIDATLKGNISRFINHSCDPNAETQKWTVNGDLRIGFFSKKDIKCGEEVTFDYQFQRYGKEGLRCFCEASNCRGWIGEEPDSSDEDDEPETAENEDEDEVGGKNQNQVVEESTMKIDEIKEDKEENSALAKTSFESEEVSTTSITDDEKNESKTQMVTRKKRKENRFARCKGGLRRDLELEEDVKLLNTSGVKNQYHTLALCRAMVRAKHLTVRISLLELLKNADLPCRRLFLDYRGLRLLAPWCDDADDFLKLQLLTVLEKLPIPNKTILKESKIFTITEKWMADTSPNKEDSSDDSRPGTPVLVDESTGLPIQNAQIKTKKICDTTNQNSENNEVEKKISDEQKSIYDLSRQLLKSWANLQEVFRIPKKERIELMKEHERQANEIQTVDNDTDKSKEDRWEDRYNRPEREKKRPVLSIIDLPRRNQTRLDDRILATVPPMSKEERRREFAARAAHQEQLRRVQTIQSIPIGSNVSTTNHWTSNNDQNMVMSNYQNEIPPPEYAMTEYVQPEYMQIDYTSNEYNNYQYPYCQNQQIYPTSANSSIPPSTANYDYNYSSTYNNVYPTSTPVLPTSSYQNVPVVTGHQSNVTTAVVLPHQISTPQHPIPTINSEPTNQNSQSIPTITPQYSFNANNTHQNNINPYYHQSSDVSALSNQNIKSDSTTFIDDVNTETNNDNVVLPWTPVRLPSKWRSMKDPRGRTYYYHVKYRISQWEPPLYSPTLHSDEDDTSIEEEEISEDDTKTTIDISDISQIEENYGKIIEGINGICEAKKIEPVPKNNGIVKKMHCFIQKPRKKRPLLVIERIISPRQEEDKINAKLDSKRYKETKEKLRRRKELALAASGGSDVLNKFKKRIKSTKHKKIKEKEKVPEVDEKAARKIKEMFRGNMARVMVHHLDPYRRDDCTTGRITNTADFKHLARKLTHFVMVKELKHCQTVNDLECNDSVKQKAKEFVKKYMAKYGPVYVRPPDEIDY